ncbi:glycosyltransferase family 2 protein [Prevotella sp. kh1p2]|uniref:glycosyltransferase family 2 protein n=1 Tax=Prevotella sp. kh1p2 TaxID=1761883 RepID=UPI0008B5F642|nr:glycosyltransferase [Prevotella sp. kh1p2]SET11484.1 Glycosyltransferase involved in cell wall bisynthesis [Prevotella sp. kh1p2]SNU11805.1 Glycosyltransferase involved in cell wall bisynthesis [Prevotellaceae bacterium KH2P17]
MDNNTSKTCAVSVIVPIYNAESSLALCLESLVGQTFTDFEVLMIDDGSPDNCGKIIDECASKYPHFKAFHKKNGGVSSARQFGIDHAQGEYTIHVDPDDWVEPTMLEELYKKAKDTDADMVICDFFENSYKGQKINKQKPSSLDHLVVLKELFSTIHGSTCNKLIRLSCYQKHDIHFPNELSFCEDQYVVAALLKSNLKVSYLNKAFYHYVRVLNQNSLSKRYTNATLEEDWKARNLFYELLKGTGFDDDVYNKKTIDVIAKAFWWGKEFYSSRAFKKEFYCYRHNVLNTYNHKMERWLLYLSCVGWYQPVIRVIGMGLKVKHLLK